MSESGGRRLHCCVLTPPGVGAVAVVRVAGPTAWPAVSRLLRGRRPVIPTQPRLGKLYYVTFEDNAQTTDDVLVCALEGGGDQDIVVDICCHGGVRVVERILMSLKDAGALVVDGAGLAWESEHGSVTIRDEAEQLLASARTRRSAEFLLQQADLLPRELMNIAAAATERGLAEAKAALDQLLRRSAAAEFMVRGVRIALTGPANAGKSSLFNRLCSRSGAVVSDRAGTTRDWVTAETALDGVSVTLIDTAGTRSTDDALERSAQRTGRTHAATADIQILMVDASMDPTGWIDHVHPSGTAPMIVAANKSDLVADDQVNDVVKRVRSQLGNKHDVLAISALTGMGLEALRQAAFELLGLHPIPDGIPLVFGPKSRGQLQSLLDGGEVSLQRFCGTLARLAGSPVKAQVRDSDE